jgi:hypothetical protein
LNNTLWQNPEKEGLPQKAFLARDSKKYFLSLGLYQKTVLYSRCEILFSFFNSFKKLQSNFLKELKKENIFWQPGAEMVF